MTKFLAKYLGGVHEGTCDFATEADVNLLKNWASESRGETGTLARDALEFAELGLRGWRYYKSHGNRASSLSELGEFIRSDPHSEVAMLGIAKGPWFTPNPVVGMCFFRRTWYNSLSVDYLTAHSLTGKEGATKVSGIGSGLLYFICDVALQLGAQKIWAEATQDSSGFYEKALGLAGVKDLVVANKEDLEAFKSAMDAKIKVFLKQ